ncbi:nuclear transport factor 2 family protein [Geodermatophilus sp. SYSU D00691]
MTDRGLQNLETVRTLFDAMGKGDLDAIRGTLADDVTLVIPGSFRYAGTFHGPDGFLGAFGQLVQASAGTLQVRLVDSAVEGADGDRVIATFHGTGRVGDEVVDEHNACLVRLDGGRITELVEFFGDPHTVARQWG